MWYGVLIGLSSVAVFLFGYAIGTAPRLRVDLPILNQDRHAKVSLLINDGETMRAFSGEAIPEPATVLALLQQVTTQNRLTLDVDKSSSMGAFVKLVADKANGDSNRYWQYYVDGEQPLVAADKYELSGGEVVLWTFSKSEL